MVRVPPANSQALPNVLLLAEHDPQFQTVWTPHQILLLIKYYDGLVIEPTPL